jgi:DNA polymerase I
MYHKYKTVEFNPASNHHVVEKLEELYGWEPHVFTDKGTPKMDERVMESLAHMFPSSVEPIVRWRTANKIRSFISGSNGSWLYHVGADGRIHGNVNSCGAGTRRMTHNSPNLGQVPSARAYLGKECRGLFGPPVGMLQVGVDADQLELRGLSHFLAPYDGGAYIHAACHGSKDNQTDIHWRNAKAVGVSRDAIKTIFYAYIYGAGDAELGSNVTGGWDFQENRRVGRRIRNKLERGVPALVKLKERLIEYKDSRGFLYDLQGQMFRLRSNHSAMNELNQRAGAIIMKVGQLIADRELRLTHGLVPGYHYEFMLTVHDEWQFAVVPEHAELVAAVAKEAIAVAGEDLKFRCPLSGDASIGNSWADTH